MKASNIIRRSYIFLSHRILAFITLDVYAYDARTKNSVEYCAGGRFNRRLIWKGNEENWSKRKLKKMNGIGWYLTTSAKL